MFRVLYFKELREVWWMGLLGCLMILYGAAVEVDFGSRNTSSGYGFLRYSEPNLFHKAPLIDRAFASTCLMWGSILAGVLGLWQTFRETQSGTWHFLLYRPVRRSGILAAKMAAAATVQGLAVVLPACAVLAWAALPGRHASPFHWTLAIPVLYALAAAPSIYLAALFAGLRRGHLLGSRWWPLLGLTIAFAVLPQNLPRVFAVWIWGFLVMSLVGMVVAVRDELNLADVS